MKDIKVPQLIINDMTAEQYKTITPAEDEFYITDEEYKDLPIGFGQLADHQPADNWAEVTDDWVLHSKYPEIWTMILGIKNKEISVPDTFVCTIETAEKISSAIKSWEKITAEQKLSKYYIIDEENLRFKFPRVLSENRCIGNNTDAVIAGPSNYNGCYTISNNGEYYEFGAFLRLEKATKIIQEETGEKTYTYYKATQWNNPDVEVGTALSGETYHPCILTEELSVLFANKLLNDKSICIFCSTQDIGEDEAEELQTTRYQIVNNYPQYHMALIVTSEDFSAKLCIYDEQLSNLPELARAIPEGCSETIITYSVLGYVEPPKVSEYNCGTRLFIKVA